MKTHSGWFLHLPLFVIPYDSVKSIHVELIKRVMTLVYENKSRSYNHDKEEYIDHKIISSIRKKFSEHLIIDARNNFEKYGDIIREGCREKPDLIYSIKLSFDVIAEKSGEISLVWSLWELIASCLCELVEKSTSSEREWDSDIDKLVRGLLHTDTLWQGHDQEEKDIADGKEKILEFVRNKGDNVHVFGGLASLMYHFPNVFFMDGIHVLAGYVRRDDENILIKGINTSYYLERCIQRYLQVEHAGPIKKSMYESCLALLSAVIETASSRAYYLREGLIRSRRVVG